MVLDRNETLHWPTLARPYGEAERALGHLAHALETTRLYQGWLWREAARSAVTIVQAGGYRARVDHLQRSLIGVPVGPEDNSTGLAAAKRVFLISAPLLRTAGQTDSKDHLWPEFWCGEAQPPGIEGDDDRQRLLLLARELAGLADDGIQPALINLFTDLRRQSKMRPLPPSFLRLVLPLALIEAGLVPKAAPGLLGGRRLALGMSAASPEAKPLSDWLATCLEDLAEEARQSNRRLVDLTRQHQAWHGALAEAGFRRHAKAPLALDLLAATPVLNIGLIAAHFGCSRVAAGKITDKLTELGILIPATSRARHKLFVAGDLSAPDGTVAAADRPLISSEPMPPLDVDALGATLDGLVADLERLQGWVERQTGAGR